MKIFLIGYRCTGKTTIGRKLAAHCDIPFIDTDDAVVEHTGMTISQMVEARGWEKFRELESMILQGTVSAESAVISTGGGIVLEASNRSWIRSQGCCIWLQATEEVILQRLYADASSRTLRPRLSDMDEKAETRQLIQQRKPLYEKTCHIRINTGTHTPDECVRHICRRLKDVRI